MAKAKAKMEEVEVSTGTELATPMKFTQANIPEMLESVNKKNSCISR